MMKTTGGTVKATNLAIGYKGALVGRWAQGKVSAEQRGGPEQPVRLHIPRIEVDRGTWAVIETDGPGNAQRQRFSVVLHGLGHPIYRWNDCQVVHAGATTLHGTQAVVYDVLIFAEGAAWDGDWSQAISDLQAAWDAAHMPDQQAQAALAAMTPEDAAIDAAMALDEQTPFIFPVANKYMSFIPSGAAGPPVIQPNATMKAGDLKALYKALMTPIPKTARPPGVQLGPGVVARPWEAAPSTPEPERPADLDEAFVAYNKALRDP